MKLRSGVQLQSVPGGSIGRRLALTALIDDRRNLALLSIAGLFDKPVPRSPSIARSWSTYLRLLTSFRMRLRVR